MGTSATASRLLSTFYNRCTQCVLSGAGVPISNQYYALFFKFFIYRIDGQNDLPQSLLFGYGPQFYTYLLTRRALFLDRCLPRPFSITTFSSAMVYRQSQTHVRDCIFLRGGRQTPRRLDLGGLAALHLASFQVRTAHFWFFDA